MNITKSRTEKIIKTLNKYRKKDTKGCYEWKGAIKTGRFPCIYVEGKSIGAHRAAWMVCNGKIPNGYFVKHRCNNKVCTNPSHLFISRDKVTKKNAEDIVSKRIGRERLTEDVVSKRIGRERIAVDLPPTIVNKIKEIARKHNQTITKYLHRRLSEIIEFEKNVDFCAKKDRKYSN